MVEYKKIVSKISIPAASKIKQKNYLSSGILPIIDQGQKLIGGYTDERQKQIICDLPVIVFGDHTKCVKYVNFPFCAGADGIKILKARNDIFPKYLYYGTVFLTYCIEDKGYARHYQHIEKQELFVPPLPEQERIVAKIEELFSQLDAAVAELKSVKEKLAIYRQSVLKEAFEFENKDLVEISSIIEDIKIGPFGTMLHKCDYVVGGIPVINPQHIKNNVIVENQSIAISEKKAEELESYKLRTNDIIMGRRGEMGRVAPVSSRENGWLCGTGSIIIRLKQEYDSVLYSKILSSPQVVHFLEKMAKGTTMKNLNEKIVARIPVPQITRDIQNDILLNTSRKTSICDNIEQTVETALQQAAALRQSILKQAFEGNL